MASVPGLQVRLHTPEDEQFEGLCKDLEANDRGLVALVAFSAQQAPAIEVGGNTLLTFIGGGLVSAIDAEATVMLRSDDRSRRSYSFHLEGVPKEMLMVLGNRRGSTRLVPRGTVRVDLLDLPPGVLSKVPLHDISATGLSILVASDVEKLLLKHARVRFSLLLPGEDSVELVAAIRHRRLVQAQVLYGLEFDGQMPEFMRTKERLLSYLTTLR